jgi:hypothetical protein
MHSIKGLCYESSQQGLGGCEGKGKAELHVTHACTSPTRPQLEERVVVAVTAAVAVVVAVVVFIAAYKQGCV